MADLTVPITGTSIRTYGGTGPNAARELAFRMARRHTAFVRVLRVLLPVTAVGLLLGYTLFVRQTFRLQKGTGQLSFSTVSISTESLKAYDPHYEGFNKDGGRYVINAKSAEQDFRQTGPIKLETIDARMMETNNNVTRLKSPSGEYFDKTGLLELYSRIEVDGDNGLKARLTRATVNTKESRIESNEPVLVEMPGSTVRGRRMVIEQKKRLVVFSDGVETRLTQDQSRTRPTRTDATPVLTSGDGPIDIVSRTLAIDDVKKTALFSGDVVAKQGQATLNAPELEVLYEDNGAAKDGAAPGGSPDQTSAPKADRVPTTNRVKLIRVPKDVVIVNGTQRATGSSAEFDQRQDVLVLHGPVVITQEPDRKATGDEAVVDNKQDTMLLTGAVVVTQARNTLRGRRLLVNRRAGTMQMTTPADGSGPAGRVYARLYSADADQPGQPAKKRPAPKAASPSEGSLMPTVRNDPNEPIDIDAASLDVDDHAKTATFRGNVVAVQGEYTVRTPELVAMYTGDSGVAFGTLTPTAAASDKKQSSELRRVEARQRVVITSKDGQSATGDLAVFDPKANTATITGNVTLTRGDAITRGRKATMDMTTGTFNMAEEVDAATSNGSAGGATKVRPTFLIIPEKAREAQKKAAEKNGESKSGEKPAASAAPPTRAPNASSWSAETKLPPERN
jgi:LPS export ABC transporter protein LptC/lipopolysaccharide transport protein LptA